MRDNWGRTIDYLRVSVTDRCNLRCIYCMPPEGVEFIPHEEILTYEEILRVCRCFASLGTRHIKITGGEPLVRKNVVSLIRALKALPGIQTVTLTTNGLLLEEYAPALGAAGVDGVNISLDTLHPARYREITRGGSLDEVLHGLDAVAKAGIPLVKVNCVPLADTEAEDIIHLAALAVERNIHVRFIELMPVGLGAEFRGTPNNRVLQLLEECYGRSAPARNHLGNGPAAYVSFPGFLGKIGFISAVGGCFCPACNRMRLGATGLLVPCLAGEAGISLRDSLAERGDEMLLDTIKYAVLHKPWGHRFARDEEHAGAGCSRAMHRIGG